MKWYAFLLLFPTLCDAQMTALFETTIYLEDALGNRDSVVVGHHMDANWYFNPDLGEVDITHPWDSVFEVRAAHFVDWNSTSDNLVLSKKIISGNEGGLHPVHDCLWFNEAIILFVHSLHLPVTISWNQDHFENSWCRNRSTLSPHMLPEVTEYWYENLLPDIDYTCLAENSSFQVDQFAIDNFGFYWIDSIQGSSTDTIGAILLFNKYQGVLESPCTSIVSVSDISPDHADVQVYPNPTKDHLTIFQGDAYTWTVFDPVSRQVLHGSGALVDLTRLSSGVFYIRILNEDGKEIHTGKIVKTD